MATSAKTLDVQELESRVKEMYREVAEHPEREFHFETGRELAERLGYPSSELDDIPAKAIDPFAGVGCYFDLADVRPGETAVDLGSGSGMDSFLAARKVGGGGRVIGIDMTDAQLEKAASLAGRAGLAQVEFRKAYIEALPGEDASVDVVISNGVAGSRSPRSSPRPSSPSTSPATPRSGLPVSAARCNATTTGKRSKTQASIKSVREKEQYRFVSERADNAT